MKETKTNRQRRLAKNERDEKAWLNIRAKSYDERRDMAAEVLAEFLLKCLPRRSSPSSGW